MGNRPVDWSPLSDGDPTPGDPHDIREEARRLENIATTIKDQARLLRQAGNNQNLKGKYADKLKEGSGDLADKLSKVEGRYTKVSGLLREWAKELEYAQEETRKALSQAKVDEKDEDKVDDAKGRMSDAVSHYLRLGNKIAGDIEDALDDDIEDSLWDDAVGWVAEHAEGFKLFLDILGWIGTALAIVAMFIPGVNLLVGIGLAIGLAVVAGRTMLVAAGKASWMDVAFDCIGLVTFAAGGLAVKGLKAAGTTAKTAATSSRVAGIKEGLAATKGMRNQLSNALASAGDDASKAAIRSEMNTLRKLISRDAGKVADGGADIGTLGKVLNQGDDEAIGVLQNLRANAAAHPDAVSGATVTGGHLAYAGAVGMQWTGFAADVGDKALGDNDTLNAGVDAANSVFGTDIGHKPSWGDYNDFKSDNWKVPASSAW
ncbi:putative T7SS-secreted protein [Streptomyces sp. NPDC042319]|uniref:putative T7SS-secreted protein n=1 Tax=Streptomyces sp. NPDC042319 TaxID=3154332 RepID=UPI0033EA7B69